MYDKKPHDPTVPVLDICEREIKPGAYIAYWYALGRCAALKLGKVVKIIAWNNGLNHRSLPDYVYRITVVGVEEQHAYDRTTGTHGVIPMLSKKGTLMFPNRCLVLDERRIPSAIKTLLDGAKLWVDQ